jgi:hypothetical protein
LDADPIFQLEQGNAAHGHAAEVEAVPCQGPLPRARCAGRIPGGYVVRDANRQALAHIYFRDSEAEALQAKVLTKDEGGGSPQSLHFHTARP